MPDNEDIISAFQADIVESLREMVADHAALKVTVERTAEKIRLEWGGERQYIAALGKRKRNAEIVAAWKENRKRGIDDRNQLAERFGVHRSTINRTISKHLAKKTSGGFGSTDWNL